jgi:hypothetical protein
MMRYTESTVALRVASVLYTTVDTCRGDDGGALVK